MRITLNLDDDAHKLLKEYAETRSISLGKAASKLIGRGFESSGQTAIVNGFHAVLLPSSSPKITSERVKQLLEEEI